MSDTFSAFQRGPDSPYEHAVLVSPDNDTDLAVASRGIYVGGTGTLKVTMLGGEAVTFTAIAAGVFHRLRVTRVWATGTTATTIHALY